MGRRQASALEILKPCLEQPGAALSALICAEHRLAQTPRGPVLPPSAASPQLLAALCILCFPAFSKGAKQMALELCVAAAVARCLQLPSASGQPERLLVPGFAPPAVGTEPADSWIPGPSEAVRACSPRSSSMGWFHSSFCHPCVNPQLVHAWSPVALALAPERVQAGLSLTALLRAARSGHHIFPRVEWRELQPQ